MFWKHICFATVSNAAGASLKKHEKNLKYLLLKLAEAKNSSKWIINIKHKRWFVVISLFLLTRINYLLLVLLDHSSLSEFLN